MFIAGRYRIDDDFKVHNIVTDENPDGDFVYDPFQPGINVLPFWGVMCTTFWGLNRANRNYLIRTTLKSELETLQFKKFWLFWFCDGDFNEQKELFFYDNNISINGVAKEKAYSVLNIFNHLLEKQVDLLIEKTKGEYQNGLNIGGISPDIMEQMKVND